MLGLAAFLAAIVGLGSLWIFARRRRQPAAATIPVAMKAKVAAATPGWTNVRLDDNEALPPWLRAIAEPERAPLVVGAPHFRRAAPLEEEPFLQDEPLFKEEPLRQDEPLFKDEPLRQDEPLLESPPVVAHEQPARLALTFAEPLEAGAMRLSVTADQTELLDQPSDVGVVLAALVAGDEIEVQDLAEPWVRVLTPSGATGWIPSASLGVGGGPPPGPKRRGIRLPGRSRSSPAS